MFKIPFNVSKSIEIEKNIEDVFKTITDFNTWSSWSPWLCQEPDCPVEISGAPSEIGHAQKWKGQIIGEGQMSLYNLNSNTSIHYNIEFLKPWKSKSQVDFFLEPVDGGTRVRWDMKGSLPIFLFFMKKMMRALIGMDYKRGLMMLKDLMESGAVHSSTTVDGKVDRNNFHYVGIKRSCSIEEMPSLMQGDFTSLHVKLEEDKLDTPVGVATLYHEYDFVNGHCEYTSAYLYDSVPNKIADLLVDSIEKHEGFKVTHRGNYKHLGNAWTTLVSHQRAMKYKPKKALPMYELYVNDPRETEEKDLITEIYMPLR